MAVLKVGKKVINGVATVSIKDSNTNKNEICINIVGYMGNLETVVIPKYANIRVEARQGDNVALPFAESSNCLTVMGDVDYAYVSNTLTVEGMVCNTSKDIKVNRYLKVTYGRERNQRENPIQNKKRAYVIKIDGDLRKLSIDVTNVSIETVVFGNVVNVEVKNCLNVKGNVNKCDVGNVIECTMGKSLAKSTATIVKTRNQINDFNVGEFKEIFGN